MDCCTEIPIPVHEQKNLGIVLEGLERKQVMRIIKDIFDQLHIYFLIKDGEIMIRNIEMIETSTVHEKVLDEAVLQVII